MAKTSMKVKHQRKAKFSSREYSRCKICGRPHAYLKENTEFAESASVSWRIEGTDSRREESKLVRR